MRAAVSSEAASPLKNRVAIGGRQHRSVDRWIAARCDENRRAIGGEMVDPLDEDARPQAFLRRGASETRGRARPEEHAERRQRHQAGADEEAAGES
jgi:hypothetical protein